MQSLPEPSGFLIMQTLALMFCCFMLKRSHIKYFKKKRLMIIPLLLLGLTGSFAGLIANFSFENNVSEWDPPWAVLYDNYYPPPNLSFINVTKTTGYFFIATGTNARFNYALQVNSAIDEQVLFNTTLNDTKTITHFNFYFAKNNIPWGTNTQLLVIDADDNVHDCNWTRNSTGVVYHDENVSVWGGDVSSELYRYFTVVLNSTECTGETYSTDTGDWTFVWNISDQAGAVGGPSTAFDNIEIFGVNATTSVVIINETYTGSTRVGGYASAEAGVNDTDGTENVTVYFDGDLYDMTYISGATWRAEDVKKWTSTGNKTWYPLINGKKRADQSVFITENLNITYAPHVKRFKLHNDYCVSYVTDPETAEIVGCSESYPLCLNYEMDIKANTNKLTNPQRLVFAPGTARNETLYLTRDYITSKGIYREQVNFSITGQSINENDFLEWVEIQFPLTIGPKGTNDYSLWHSDVEGSFDYADYNFTFNTNDSCVHQRFNDLEYQNERMRLEIIGDFITGYEIPLSCNITFYQENQTDSSQVFEINITSRNILVDRMVHSLIEFSESGNEMAEKRFDFFIYSNGELLEGAENAMTRNIVEGGAVSWTNEFSLSFLVGPENLGSWRAIVRDIDGNPICATHFVPNELGVEKTSLYFPNGSAIGLGQRVDFDDLNYFEVHLHGVADRDFTAFVRIDHNDNYALKREVSLEIEDNLRHLWSFNEASGVNASDSIGDKDLILVNGTAFNGTASKFTTSGTITLDGVDDYAIHNGTVTDIDYEKGAVSAWVKKYSDDNSKDIIFSFSKESSTNTTVLRLFYDMRGGTDHIRAQYKIGDVDYWDMFTDTGSADECMGEWCHVILRQNGTIPAIFLNSVEQGLTFEDEVNTSKWFFDIVNNDTDPAQVFAIGANRLDNTAVEHFGGDIGEIHVLNGTVTDSYIGDLTIFGQHRTGSFFWNGFNSDTNLFLRDNYAFGKWEVCAGVDPDPDVTNSKCTNFWYKGGCFVKNISLYDMNGQVVTPSADAGDEFDITGSYNIRLDLSEDNCKFQVQIFNWDNFTTVYDQSFKDVHSDTIILTVNKQGPLDEYGLLEEGKSTVEILALLSPATTGIGLKALPEAIEAFKNDYVDDCKIGSWTKTIFLKNQFCKSFLCIPSGDNPEDADIHSILTKKWYGDMTVARWINDETQSKYCPYIPSGKASANYTIRVSTFDTFGNWTELNYRSYMGGEQLWNQNAALSIAKERFGLESIYCEHISDPIKREQCNILRSIRTGFDLINLEKMVAAWRPRMKFIGMLVLVYVIILVGERFRKGGGD